MPRVENEDVTVTLKKGVYRFVCDPHATIMKGVSGQLTLVGVERWEPCANESPDRRTDDASEENRS